MTPKCVMSGGIHLRDLAPEQHSSEEISQRWRVHGNTASDLTGPGIESEILSRVAKALSHKNNERSKNLQGKQK